MSRQSPSADAEDPVAVVRTALAAAVSSLAGFDEHDPGAEFATKRVLNMLADTLRPIQNMLITATESDPAGPLASALVFLRNGVEHLDAGDIAAARAAVVTAHVALARLDHLDPGDWRDVGPGDWRL